jgi:8-oxo-dGTP diphosphatase
MKTGNKKYHGDEPKYPAVAADVLILSIIKEKLNVLLIKISRGPYKDNWALPGRSIANGENLDDAATDVLWEKGGIKDVYLEQLYTFGGINRDVRKRVISIAYFALVDSDKHSVKTTDYYSDIKWWPVDKLPLMAFDHKEIIEYGGKRLKAKIEYSNIAYGLLPKKFTMTEMQRVYEIILGVKLDKRNFRKKIKMLNIIEPTKKMKVGMKNRPAELYRFKKRGLVFTK